ncbi:MAG: nucleoside triphosphate pyrophosphohydrolase [Sphingobacteriia bacterium 24-36-13]|uniref:nucleoside triphosphate pyrophosphohydrolase n=1 Tax=Sediminibacterium sp. TaxID=1917865 RepID=UPI000BDD0E2B|nr:nucleoside triphosphate pyrophosphohydrolase [Sediminibacterium sp.]OYZ51960.1 MAG: nucleoside triphosphate pyrophosphohydrolase [Sphingobacteriia bacterium 24-36-13]HQS25233.1 nucleoside triphosphate pyrophosphohydrolase [Sediminibacterium sp.]
MAADAFLQLVKIMDELREKCPWDQKQTIHTLRSMTIEELYELVDAIDANDWQGIKEELGDLFLHLLFYSKIGSEQHQFKLEEVLNGISEKLIRRHPHIYGDIKVKDEEEVKRNWQKIKSVEGKSDKSILEGVPKSLPAIVKAARIQEKAKQVGFEWENKADVWKKVDEEIEELQLAEKNESQAEIEAEFGDVLFSLINYARFLQVDPEAALEKTNQKFIQRFKAMETIALGKGLQLTDLSLLQMDELWNSVKKKN